MTKTNLADLFTKRSIICGLAATDKDACLKELLCILGRQGRLSEPDLILGKFLEREQQGPTMLTEGLAIPHVRISGISKVAIALGTSPHGVGWDNAGLKKAHVIFIILVPIDKPDTYLEVLAAISGVFMDKKNIYRVAGIATPEEVESFFHSYDGIAVLPHFLTAHELMSTEPKTLKPNDSIKKAIDLLCMGKTLDIPVVDDDGDLIGIFTEECLLTLALPQQLRWVENLSSIIHFEPFAHILENEDALQVGELMSHEYVTVEEFTPAIQVTARIMATSVRQVMVVNDGKLVGVISVQQFLQGILR